MSVSDELFEYLNFLENEAAQSKVLGGVTKASGLFCLATGAVTLATLPGWGLFALAGGLAYGGQLLRESRKTGRLMPVPFSELGIDTIVKGVAKGVSGGDADDLLDYHYLSPRQKSDYALLSIAGEEIGAALDAIPDEYRQRALWGQVSRRFHQMYGSAIDKSPDYVSIAADKSDILTYLLASPETMRVLQREAREYSQNQPQALPSADVEPVGNDTRANALEASYQAVDESVAVAVANPAMTALDVILNSPYTSRAIFGAQRCGKSYLAAIASQKLSEQGTAIYHINLASFGDEDKQYWGHAKKSVTCDLTALDYHAATRFINDAIATVNLWWKTKNAILVIDEWAYVGSSSNAYIDELAVLLKLVADKISAVASTGIKRQQALWSIAPEFVAGGLVQDAKAIKKLQVCLLAIPKGKSVDWQGSSITFNAELFDQLSRNYPLSPMDSSRLPECDRAAFIDGAWLPVGLEKSELKKSVAETNKLDSNELIADIRSKLIDKDSPLLASQIKQQVWSLKKQNADIKDVEKILESMVNMGLVSKDENNPPRYSVDKPLSSL